LKRLGVLGRRLEKRGYRTLVKKRPIGTGEAVVKPCPWITRRARRNPMRNARPKALPPMSASFAAGINPPQMLAGYERVTDDHGL